MTDQPRMGPKAAEDEIPLKPRGRMSGLPMRAVLPNAITAAAMCSGLTGIRFAMSDRWAEAVFAHSGLSATDQNLPPTVNTSTHSLGSTYRSWNTRVASPDRRRST